MTSRSRRACYAFALAILFAPVAAADGAPLPDGWHLVSMPGKAVTRFTAMPGGGISVAAKDSVGFLYREAATVPGSGRYLTWRWRVDTAPPVTDLSMKGMDDRPLALHVWFKDDGESEWDLATRFGAWLSKRPLPGKMLTYVWGGRAGPGTTLRNPYQEKTGAIVILRSGGDGIGQWFAETVDVVGDFERAFGHAPASPAFVAISADADDKGGSSSGMVDGLAFTGKR